MFRVRNWRGEEINSGTSRERTRIADNGTLRDTGDAAGVPALKGELKKRPDRKNQWGTTGARVNQPKWDRYGQIVSMFVAT